MDTMLAFMNGEASRGNEQKVFDWITAIKIMIESNCNIASAGLIEDYDYTVGDILRNKEPCLDDYCYLASTWATPTLYYDGHTVACWKMQSDVPDYGSDTKWPEDALKLFRGVWWE
jgi:hypothetical protein